MKRIRRQTQKEIFEKLDETEFTQYNFDVNFMDEGDTIIEVFFKPNPNYYFKINEGKSYNNRFITKSLPGEFFLKEETNEFNGFESAMSFIKTWSRRILEDLREENPLIDSAFQEIEKIRQEFEKSLSDLNISSDEFFDEDEMSSMQKKLEKLYEEFDKLKEKNKITEKELEKVKEELISINSSIESLPKVTWYRAAGNRVLNIFDRLSKSKEVQKALVNTTKALITGETTPD